MDLKAQMDEMFQDYLKKAVEPAEMDQLLEEVRHKHTLWRAYRDFDPNSDREREMAERSLQELKEAMAIAEKMIFFVKTK